MNYISTKEEICTGFCQSKTIHCEKEIKIKYEQLAGQLKLIKELKEENKSSYTKPIYTDEDKEFLRQAVVAGELSISDLTLIEAIIAGFTGSQHRRAERNIYRRIKFTSEEKEAELEFHRRNNKIHKKNRTPKVLINLYTQSKKKK